MASNTFHWPRRATQLVSLLLLALIPALGIFRIDFSSASYHILGRDIFWSDFAFMVGLVLVTTTAPVLTYMTIGTVWCGWACPQNLLSEWANNLTYKFLGKRADVRVDGKGVVIAASKNKVINWLILGVAFLGAALVLAFIPVLLFYPPSVAFTLIPFVSHHESPNFLVFMYYFTVLLIFIDIAVARYLFCDYACFYRIGQRIFKTKNALHIAYDASRSSDCSRCSYCATSCITAIEPTDIKTYDACIGCGECIDACDSLHAGAGKEGLLYFEIGAKGGSSTWKQKLREMSSRLNWMIGAFLVLGCALIAWAVATQPPVQSKESLALQLKDQQIAHICDNQCSALESSCNGKNMKGCYLGAACRCECLLQHEPDSDSSAQWRQCVKYNTAHADALGALKLAHHSGKP